MCKERFFGRVRDEIVEVVIVVQYVPEQKARSAAKMDWFVSSLENFVELYGNGRTIAPC